MTRRLRAGLSVLVVLLAALTGCLSMPTSGTLTEVDDPGAGESEAPADIVVRPPQPGESARDIAVHFLDAMEASPISTKVAREFLSQEISSSWDPSLGTIVYGSRSAPTGAGTDRTAPVDVSIDLDDAGQFDSRGSWLGPLSKTDEPLQLDLPMVREDGEWRIAEAPNALIVRDAWFAERFDQVSVYFFNPAGEVLVPEPVYLPSGDQLPTYLVSDLVAGPSPELADVERGYFPAGTTVRPVTVAADGRAEIALQSDSSPPNARGAELMLAQLTWTLQQVPGIKYLQVTFNDGPLRLAHGTADQVPVKSSPEYDPTGSSAPSEPFALRDGLLVSGPLDDPVAVNGPFGRTRLGLRSIAVDPTGARVAGVGTAGDRVLVGPLRDDQSDTAKQVVDGATDLLPPGWDLAGRLWLVDRRAGGALISIVEKGRVRPVTIRGVSGREVQSFVVSRDGTRFVAVVRGPERDVLRQSRIQVSDSGRVSATPARTMPFDELLPSRISDLSWSSPIALLVLAEVTPGAVEVRPLPIDGSPSSGLPGGTIVSGRMRWLAGSPAPGEPWYAIGARPRSVVDSAGNELSRSLDGVDLRTLTYPG
ncbi:LpqB family beta-propeller domain-containing protein [Nocardioides sp.]|uniref:LpqB family beta-propeller domain-containing protein n=1 Tax=Nocardioides sp. TaxID=35761 RepID=UPI003528229C